MKGYSSLKKYFCYFITEVSFILSFIGHDEREHLDLANNVANSFEFVHFWILSEALHVRIKRSYFICSFLKARI